MTSPGKGLPIGLLTSQHFANYYLDGLDRLVLEKSRARAYVRYMDDMVWWCRDKGEAKAILRMVREYLQAERRLMIKKNVQIQRTSMGLPFCGFRIFPGCIRLNRRKKSRYNERRNFWEKLYGIGMIDAHDLQRAYDSIKGIIAPASARQWMKRQLSLHPSPEV